MSRLPSLPPHTQVFYNPYPSKKGTGKFYMARIAPALTRSKPFTKRFASRQDAYRWAVRTAQDLQQKVVKHGETLGDLTPQQLGAASLAFEKLKGFPDSHLLTLVELWQLFGTPDYHEMTQLKAELGKLGQNAFSKITRAIKFFRDTCPARDEDIRSLKQVTDAWVAHQLNKTQKRLKKAEESAAAGTTETLAASGAQAMSAADGKEKKARKPGQSDYLRGMRCVFKRINATLGEHLFHLLQKDELQKWLDSLECGNNTLRHYHKDLRTVWNWAIKQGFARTNPWLQVTLPDKEPVEIGILTPFESRSLLQTAATDHEWKMLATITLGLFVGGRPRELSRLTWNHLRLNSRRPFVKFDRSVAKTRHRRAVELSPNAMAWLALVPQDQRVGKIMPGRWTNLLPPLRQKAGIKIWPHNALRHSFASYFAAIHGETKTAEKLGHTDHGTIKEHYQTVVTPEAADAFWSVSPGMTSEQIEQLRAAA